MVSLSHRVMVLMVLVVAVFVGDQGEERLQQVKEINPANHHQHLVNVIRSFFLVVVSVVAGFVRVHVQTQKLDAGSGRKGKKRVRNSVNCTF